VHPGSIGDSGTGRGTTATKASVKRGTGNQRRRGVRTMNTVKVVAVAILGAVTLALAAASQSTAGTFVMKQCEGALLADFQASYQPINGSKKVDVANACVPGGAGKIGVYQDRSGSNFNFGDGGMFIWRAPAE